LNDRRHNYTTPKSFLELINLYLKILQNKHHELASKMSRLENGLEKLRVTASQVRPQIKWVSFSAEFDARLTSLSYLALIFKQIFIE
jgi:vacuolar-type H+-ATPase subunit D/Vma8